jgi:hypothetical protein
VNAGASELLRGMKDGNSGKTASGGVAGEREMGTPAVRQHLVIAPVVPEVSGELAQWDRNLAGQRLLPALPREDWTRAEDIAAEQEGLTDAEKRALHQIEAPEAPVGLWLNGDELIVLPEGRTRMTV